MPWTSEHLAWLHDTGSIISTSCGKNAPVFEFRYSMTDEMIMSAWAKHFRNHYCLDDELELLKPDSMTSSDYLMTLKFPHSSTPLGRA